jgi:hypothetical protein
MKKYEITREQVDKLSQYLGAKPYSEVFQTIEVLVAVVRDQEIKPEGCEQNEK